jgi:hypothetical protein
MGLDTKTYWLTDHQSQCDFDLITRESGDGREKSRRAASCETVAGQWGREHVSWGSYGAGSRYQATAGDDTAD